MKDLPANDAVILLNLNSTDETQAEDLPEQGFPHRASATPSTGRRSSISSMSARERSAQVATQPEHELFNEREATQYTEFRSKDLSNDMLDKIMPNKDGEGFRLDESGKRFTINFMVADVFGLSYPDVMQMVQKYAQAVGIDIQIGPPIVRA